MDTTAILLSTAHEIVARADTVVASRPPIYKPVGISLAVASGLFIGVSFVLKKVGLLRANTKYDEVPGEGYGYLKNFYWWSGMTLMIVGEICNFVAYAFVDAILVTPLGALSVVITAVLSAIFLKERLSAVGKVGCFLCIIGSIVILLNAPESSSVANITEMQHFVIQPGFLSYAGVVIVGSAVTAIWVAPKYGKKSMLVYLSICSFVGGLSVVATQGLGAAIIAQINGTPQFNQWFLYVLFVFVIATLVTEIIYLNVSEVLPYGETCTNHKIESSESIQCRPCDAYLLRLLHVCYYHYLSDPFPRIQGNCCIHHDSGSGFLNHLFGSCAFAALKIGQGCARCGSLCRRPRPTEDDCGTGAARIRAKGRLHSWNSCYRQEIINSETQKGNGGSKTTA
jgi:drug/metabolite transporter (DMT)-like permease